MLVPEFGSRPSDIANIIHPNITQANEFSEDCGIESSQLHRRLNVFFLAGTFASFFYTSIPAGTRDLKNYQVAALSSIVAGLFFGSLFGAIVPDLFDRMEKIWTNFSHSTWITMMIVSTALLGTNLGLSVCLNPPATIIPIIAGSAIGGFGLTFMASFFSSKWLSEHRFRFIRSNHNEIP